MAIACGIGKERNCDETDLAVFLELAPADNYHQFHDALAVYRGDKTSRRNQGLPTTKSPL